MKLMTFISGVFFLTGCGSSTPLSRPLTRGEHIQMISQTFGVSAASAPEFERNLQETCRNIPTSEQNKKFLCDIAGAAINSNEVVFSQRLGVIELGDGTCADSRLEQICSYYKLSAKSSHSELLSRVDVVPVSLLAAQAALESGWGQSRFAQRGFNFFGRHGSCSDPLAMKATGADVCLKGYASVASGVGDQIRYFNAAAFKFTTKFRTIRQRQRVTGDGLLDPMELAEAFTGYAEIGGYVERVQGMLTRYGLQKLDSP